MAFIDQSSKHLRLKRKTKPIGFYPRCGKRLFDLTVCLIILPLIFFAILFAWSLAKTLGPSGFFSHPRIGRNGTAFRCWKIRTMIENADEALVQVFRQRPETRKEWANYRKLEHDPRILPYAGFMRRTGLDELPQIWNVIRGDMSLVGPRPVTRPELSLFGDAKMDYLGVRPGITGLWQVKARQSPCYKRRVKLDRRYARNISFRADLHILFWTVPALFRATGR